LIERGKTQLTYFKSQGYRGLVAKETVRTSLDIPVALHRRLREAAAKKGCSARQIILRSYRERRPGCGTTAA
jgi:hypothetical protein